MNNKTREPCPACKGERGFEVAASSTHYFWKDCPHCNGTGFKPLMQVSDIERWRETVAPHKLRPIPWELGNGGSWDQFPIQPVSDEMLMELALYYRYQGAPWNCRSTPLSDADREYMFLLYYSMEGMVARIRMAEKRIAELESQLEKGQENEQPTT